MIVCATLFVLIEYFLIEIENPFRKRSMPEVFNERDLVDKKLTMGVVFFHYYKIYVLVKREQAPCLFKITIK